MTYLLWMGFSLLHTMAQGCTIHWKCLFMLLKTVYLHLRLFSVDNSFFCDRFQFECVTP